LIRALQPWLVGGAGLAVVALAAGLLPGRLMREATGGRWLRRDALVLVAAGLGAGLATLAGLALLTPLDGPTRWTLAACAIVLTCVLLTDLRAMVIADLHIVALLVAALVGPLARWPLEALAGAAVGGGLLWGVRLAFRRVRGVEGLGLGDVKLMVALGALLGPERVLWVIVAGALLGLAWGLRAGRASDHRTIVVPFGAAAAPPALATLLLAWAGP